MLLDEFVFVWFYTVDQLRLGVVTRGLCARLEPDEMKAQTNFASPSTCLTQARNAKTEAADCLLLSTNNTGGPAPHMAGLCVTSETHSVNQESVPPEVSFFQGTLNMFFYNIIPHDAL